MSPKHQRTLERELKTLFSEKALLRISALDALKSLGPFHPAVMTKSGKIFLSDQGITSLQNICNIVAENEKLRELSTLEDVHSETVKAYEDWLAKGAVPQALMFSNQIIESIEKKIEKHNFAVRLVGFALRDSEELLLGAARIQKTGKALLETLDIKNHSAEDLMRENFETNYVLIGEADGTTAVAQNRFYIQAILCVGVLLVYGTIRYQRAFSNSRVRALIAPQESLETTHLLKWNDKGTDVWFSTSWPHMPPLSFSQDDIKYFTEQCFLAKIFNLLEIDKKTELEESIVRSIYWFSDAYRDNTPTMRFIKLWTAAECFFAFEQEQISDANATGMAALLVFSGYGIEKPENYRKIKTQIKKLYKLRSKAIHRAKFDHIDTEHVNVLSYWIAWIIISMASLSQQGYKTLQEIRDQALRLDGIVKP